MTYQVWRFIAPGLHTNEKRLLVPFLLLAVGGSIAGALFSHYVVFPGMTLEVSYGGFVLSRSRRGATRLAAWRSRSRMAKPLGSCDIAGHSARVYELGPEPPPDDIGGRMPSVVTWHDAEMFYLLAGEMATERRSDERRIGAT